MRRAGADVVFSGEGEVALAMTEFMLRQLGATPEQMDRERDRIRHELFGEANLEEPVGTQIQTAADGAANASQPEHSGGI
jgi:CPA2 family monovalent cation:H+ antiporter-2